MIVDCAVYEDGRRREGKVPLEQAYGACRGDGAFAWIGLHEPSADEFDSVRREFDLHGLAVEDAIKAHQRPKIEVYGDSLFVVLKTARYVDPEEVIETGEILLFVGEDFIISVRHGEASDLAGVRQRIEAEDREVLRLGPAGVLYAILDRVVDDYAPVVHGVDTDVSEVEEQVFSPDRNNPTERVYKLKREVLEFHRSTAPLSEPLQRLAEGKYRVIPDEMRHHYRDVADHLLRVIDQVEGQRDLLTSVLDANLTQVSLRQNEDVRRISAWVAIIAVPTMIAGIYGMNFEHMPELKWTYGYPLALALMASICATLYRYFRRSGWL